MVIRKTGITRRLIPVNPFAPVDDRVDYITRTTLQLKTTENGRLKC